MPALNIKQPDLTGSYSASSIVTGKINTDLTHYGIYLECLTAAGALVTAAQVLNDIEYIQIYAGGIQLMHISPTVARDLALFYNKQFDYATEAGVIHIPLYKSFLDSAEGRALFAWGMRDIQEGGFQVNVKLTAGALTVARIRVSTESTEEPRILGRHTRIAKHTQAFDGTGIHEVTNLPKSGLGYRAIHILEGAGTIDNVTLKIGSQRFLIEEMSAEVNNLSLKLAGRSPQAGYYHIDLTRFNNANDFLPMEAISDLRLDVDWSVTPGGSYEIYTERDFVGLRGA